MGRRAILLRNDLPSSFRAGAAAAAAAAHCCSSSNNTRATSNVRTATRFVLVDTRHAGNVGGAARALLNMGFDDLRLVVSPLDGGATKLLNKQRTKEAASGALFVLENAKVHETLREATEGVTVVCATAMPHDMSRSRPDYAFQAPRVYFRHLLTDVCDENEECDDEAKASTSDISIAFVFGNERVGMKAEDIQQCDVVLGIPTNPQFGSLNLASAVQLIAYDWREAIGGFSVSSK